MRKSEEQKRIDGIFNPLPIKSKSDIIRCTLLRQGKGGAPNMTLWVEPENYYMLKRIVDKHFTRKKSKDAFIKAYYLYELLVQDYAIGGFIINEEIRATLGIDKELLIRIRRVLVQLNILKVNADEYTGSMLKSRRCKSLSKGIEVSSSKTYSYEAREFLNSSGISLPVPLSLLHRNKPIHINYRLSSYTYDLIGLYKDLEKCRELDTEEAYKRVRYILLRFSKRNYQKSNGINEDFLQNTVSCPSNTYIAPYDKLDFDNEFPKIVLRVRKWDTLFVWFLHRDAPAKVTDSSRLWHPFHSLAREYRKHLMFNGSHLMEAMDVHNCFYVLMLKAFEQNDSIDCNEMVEFSNLVRSGRFYEFFVEELMKKYLTIHTKEELRMAVKHDLQSYRNITNAGQLRYLHKELDNIFIEKFPTIREALLHYPTVINKEGKRVKRLQTDMCHLETFLISKVCFTLKANGVTPFSLHDGVYVSEEDMEVLRNKLGLDTIQNVQAWVEGLFWEYFDDLTPERVTLLF